MTKQLISYIAPAAPATRRLAYGNEPFLRPEIGFTPKWYRMALEIDFGKPWHTNVVYRRQSLLAIRNELKKRFPDTCIGQIDEPDQPMDLLTGVFGACTVAGLFGIPIVYSPDNWPNCEHRYLANEQIDALTVPDLNNNGFFQSLLSQVDYIAKIEGTAKGFINWQGVLNNALRLRGETLFFDLFDCPDRVQHLFQVICDTMILAAKRLYEKQAHAGFIPEFFTISNCSVNMISPQQYEVFILPQDKQLAEAFGCIGIHNCSWDASPYLKHYAAIPNLGYIDMGLQSDLSKARHLFPAARRALMYTPMDLANKTMTTIHENLEYIAENYGPCDVIVADIEAGTPDEKVLEFVDLCHRISKQFNSKKKTV